MKRKSSIKSSKSKTNKKNRFKEFSSIVIETDTDNKLPDTSIIKSPKTSQSNNKKKKIIPDCSPSKQPLIQTDLIKNGGLLNQTTSNFLQQSEQTKPNKVTTTIILPQTINTIVTTANVVPGTMSSGRERILTTFGDQNNKTKTSTIIRNQKKDLNLKNVGNQI